MPPPLLYPLFRYERCPVLHEREFWVLTPSPGGVYHDLFSGDYFDRQERFMILAVTIDVEEEGLFSGKYEGHDAPARNIPELERLDSVFRESGIRPTLLVSYQAVRDASNQEVLLNLRDRWQGEIGAHLHHWNTPPIVELPYRQPVDSELMPVDLLEAKLNTLLKALKAMGADPLSFRMGRFNLGPKMFSVLERSPICTDSSIEPMRKEPAGPDHLSAPTGPYFPDSGCPTLVGNSRIMEIPMTLVPINLKLRQVLLHIEKHGLVSNSAIGWLSRTVLALSTQPMAMGLGRLKAAVRIHQLRGGEVLTVYFHSSELMPGGCPKHRSDADVKRFVEKLRQYFTWLRKGMVSDSLTLSEVGEMFRARASGMHED